MTALVNAVLEAQECFQICVFEASRLASTKALLLKRDLPFRKIKRFSTDVVEVFHIRGFAWGIGKTKLADKTFLDIWAF